MCTDLPLVLVRGGADSHNVLHFCVDVAHVPAARAAAVCSEISQVLRFTRVRRQEGAAALRGALALLGRRVPHAHDRRQKRRHRVRRGIYCQQLCISKRHEWMTS